MRIQQLLVFFLLVLLVYTCSETSTQDKTLQISWQVPEDVNGGLAGKDVVKIQAQVDQFAWETFLALNWPVLPGQAGEPDTLKNLGDPGPRVWETWKEASEVYLSNGQKPSPWGQSDRIKRAQGVVALE